MIRAALRSLMLLLTGLVTVLTPALPFAQTFQAQTRLGASLPGDTWEPAIAADRYGHVYVLIPDFPPSCKGCPSSITDGGGTVDPAGNVYFSWDGYKQNGGAKGPVNLYVTKSSDGGQTWTPTLLDVSGAPPDCSAFSCGWAFLSQFGNTTPTSLKNKFPSMAAEVAQWLHF